MNQHSRIRPLFQLATRCFPLLALGILSIPTASAAPPDLTAAGVIAGINRSETYNLGATGLRGWIYITTGASETHGSNGTMTGESRQILVTVASAQPGDPDYATVQTRLQTHARNLAAAGLTYTAEFSANLTYWTPSNSGSTVLTGAGSHEIEVIAIPFPATVPLSLGGTEDPPKFFRIHVAETP